MPVQAPLDTSPRKRGLTVKEYLDISAVSIEMYWGLGPREVVDEGCSQCSLCLCSSQM